jgi:CHAD domain-containing protein
MQRELVLDSDRPLVEALTRAFEAMLDEARTQSRRAVEEPAGAVHDFRRAMRRAEALLALSRPMLRKVPRCWLDDALTRGRNRTRVVRDLDAVMPLVARLQELELFEAGSSDIDGLRAWLEACRSEVASQEIVAWRLRKNVRALAGLGDIFQSALHAWVDLDLLIESLRDSYRSARKAWKNADDTRRVKDVHELRRRVRALRYQLELLSSLRRPQPATPPPAPGEPAPAPPREPPWLDGVVSAHTTMKALVRDLGAVTDLIALRAMVDSADEDALGFDRKHLSALLAELTEGRIERVMVDAAAAFATPPKEFLVPSPQAAAMEPHATTD